MRDLSRRSFIGMVSFSLTAAAIVRVGSLMPVKLLGDAMPFRRAMTLDEIERIVRPPILIMRDGSVAPMMTYISEINYA